MIFKSLVFLEAQLDEYLSNKHIHYESIVKLAPYGDPQGIKADENKNRMVISLVNMKKVTTPQLQPVRKPISGESFYSEPPLFLNLYVLVAANFDESNHKESLLLLSDTLGFFQRKPVFNHENSPMLDPNIEKLSLQVENLSLHELSNLWGMLGRKYLPCVLYKVDLITYNAEDIVFTGHPVSQHSSTPQRG